MTCERLGTWNLELERGTSGTSSRHIYMNNNICIYTPKQNTDARRN